MTTPCGLSLFPSSSTLPENLVLESDDGRLTEKPSRGDKLLNILSEGSQWRRPAWLGPVNGDILQAGQRRVTLLIFFFQRVLARLLR